MKTSFIPLFIALSIPACVDHSARSGASGKSDSATVIITQPSTPENIGTVVDTLLESLTRVAEATSGAQVPNPHLSILTADGKTLDVSAPKLESGFFGENTPKARQARLEGHLKALADKLTAGCTTRVVPVQIVKTAVASAKDGSLCQVWAAGGGLNPWSTKDTNPPRFIEDRETFAGQLYAAAVQNQHFLILTDATGVEAARPKVMPAPPKVAKAKPAPAKPKPTPAPVASIAPDPKQGEVAAKSPATPTTAPNQPPHMVMQPGGSVIVNVGRDDDKAGSPSKAARIELPNDAERIGEPIRFERGQSTPLNKEELERIVRELRNMKARFEFRVVLSSRADIEKGSTPGRNQELSEQRANVCRAYMLENGISVHQVVCIGSSLAESTAEHERQVIFHVIDKVERKVPDVAKTASN
jgi:outer membrane protein OmpA-like peptidoglycan-associated protein